MRDLQPRDDQSAASLIAIDLDAERRLCVEAMTAVYYVHAANIGILRCTAFFPGSAFANGRLLLHLPSYSAYGAFCRCF